VTAGEVATLTNAFIVQPTLIVLSSGPPSAQQTSVTLTILGQHRNGSMAPRPDCWQP
jgi:hypothetical protein